MSALRVCVSRCPGACLSVGFSGSRFQEHSSLDRALPSLSHNRVESPRDAQIPEPRVFSASVRDVPVGIVRSDEACLALGAF